MALIAAPATTAIPSSGRIDFTTPGTYHFPPAAPSRRRAHRAQL